MAPARNLRKSKPKLPAADRHTGLQYRFLFRLLRNGREQFRLHQRLELLVIGLEMQAQLGAVGVHRQRIDGDLFVGVAFIFLYSMPAFTSDDMVAAVIESDVITSRLKFTPLEKSIV